MNSLNLNHFIDGADTVCGSSRIEVVNPARPAEIVGTICRGTPEDVDNAVRSAALAQLAWKERPLEERCAVVKAAGEELLASADTGAPTLTREMGKVLAESTMDFAAPGFGWTALVDDVAGVRHALVDAIEDDFGRIDLRRRPMGVVGAIVPWNWPLALLGVKLGPALIAGNTVVVVPSPHASLSVLHAVEALSRVLPAGVVNVVTGVGSEVGAALVAHPNIAMVAFTGGVEVGRAVAASAGQHLKPAVLELGGNDAAVLLDDVEVTDALIRAIASGAMMTSGQVCFAIKRLLVHESLYDDVVSQLGDALASTVVGDGMDPDVTMGPLANATQHARFNRLVEDARRDGAKVRDLGRLTPGFAEAEGYFHLPKLVTEVTPEATIVVAEQFGPALPILPFTTDDEAISLVNGTAFGLTSSLWSADVGRAHSLASRIDAGVTFVNQHGMAAFDPRAPFGGTKHSGFGREMGIEGLLEFTWTQAINNRHLVS
ncbi:aldehyde dehydrogenase family protein [Prauserella flavalba]|uniref:aldehyde dehydrogenase family protein n=1 Tax=Prauserella flavalba TaxID=1477506 RepID=UPI0036E0650F